MKLNREHVVAASLVGTVVVVLGFASGIGQVPHTSGSSDHATAQKPPPSSSTSQPTPPAAHDNPAQQPVSQLVRHQTALPRGSHPTTGVPRPSQPGPPNHPGHPNPPGTTPPTRPSTPAEPCDVGLISALLRQIGALTGELPVVGDLTGLTGLPGELTVLTLTGELTGKPGSSLPLLSPLGGLLGDKATLLTGLLGDRCGLVMRSGQATALLRTP